MLGGVSARVRVVGASRRAAELVRYTAGRMGRDLSLVRLRAEAVDVPGAA